MIRSLDERISSALHQMAARTPSDPPALDTLTSRLVEDGEPRDGYVTLGEGPTPRRRRRPFGAALAVAAAASFAVIGLSLRDVERDVLPQSTTPLGSDGGDLQPDPEVEERAKEDVAAFEATMGDPIPIAQGVDPTFGRWSVAVTISDGSLDNGFCVTGTAGGSCGVGADLDLFGLITRSGGPVPVVVWGAPMPITTVRVEWGDGTRHDVEVVRPPGESFGFAATVMPSVDADFTSEGVDAAGQVVVSGVSDSHPYEHVVP